jgi:hypothetical protein
MVWGFPLWRWAWSLALLAALLLPVMAAAQDDDDGPVVVEDFITYGETVEGNHHRARHLRSLAVLCPGWGYDSGDDGGG